MRGQLRKEKAPDALLTSTPKIGKLTRKTLILHIAIFRVYPVGIKMNPLYLPQNDMFA